jgi:hypothetical protein
MSCCMSSVYTTIYYCQALFENILTWCWILDSNQSNRLRRPRHNPIYQSNFVWRATKDSNLVRKDLESRMHHHHNRDPLFEDDIYSTLSSERQRFFSEATLSWFQRTPRREVFGPMCRSLTLHFLRLTHSVLTLRRTSNLEEREGLEPSVAGFKVQCVYQFRHLSAIWCPQRDSNSQNLVSKTSMYAIPSQGLLLLGRQSETRTQKIQCLKLARMPFRQLPYLEEGVGFEPTGPLLTRLLSRQVH